MPNEILTRAIDAVCDGTHLTADHASAVLDEVMEGRAGEVETAAFLVGLRAKGETVAELTGLARTMRRLAASVEAARDDLVDTAGTGGGPSTFNISTAAALVAAGAGCAVAKHGNRSNTSRSGSADLLEALGVRIDLDPEAVAQCVEEVGFGFMFAPRHHAAMKHVVPVRKELGVRTIFNFLGPLTNPAGARRQLLGVSDRRYQETIAEALDRPRVRPGAGGLGRRRARRDLGRRADPGDRGPRRRDAGMVRRARRPRHHRGSLELIAGGCARGERGGGARGLDGSEQGPARDVVLLNAGAAILAGGGADDLRGRRRSRARSGRLGRGGRGAGGSSRRSPRQLASAGE